MSVVELETSAMFLPEAMVQACEDIRNSVTIVQDEAGRAGVYFGAGRLAPEIAAVATLPPIYPEWLGDASFIEAHPVKFPYIAGDMAGGISGPDLIVAMGRIGMMGFLGAGGQSLAAVHAQIGDIQRRLGASAAWGANLIHTPHHPRWESEVTDLYIREGVGRVSVSAFMAINENVVRLSLHGLRRTEDGIRRRHHLFAKISRPELAEQFMAPAPPEMVQALVRKGHLTQEEADLARHIPLAEDITVEADSGGHTDNRPLHVLMPVILAIRERALRRFASGTTIRVGAAGGLGTPHALAAAFSTGAAYVLTGSINQSSREASVSDAAKDMLSQATLADTAMAPSADMFELGGRVQVLRRGTWFPQRAALLYETYRNYAGLAEIPEALKARLEKEIFRMPLSQIWDATRQYFLQQDPSQLKRAAEDAKFQMALVFRWYLSQSSRWAVTGDLERRMDYQLWCGPVMGAFNEWVRGSFLESVADRSVDQMALNLMEGAAVMMRLNQLRLWGVPVPLSYTFRPRLLALG